MRMPADIHPIPAGHSVPEPLETVYASKEIACRPVRRGLRLPAMREEPVPGGVVLIGNFDGVHLGHKALIREAKSLGTVLEAPVGVLSFEPHPGTFFSRNDKRFRIADPVSKRELIGANGVDFLFQPRFDESIASLSPERFIERILIETLHTRAIVVGEDFRFGRGRSGDVTRLRDVGWMHGVAVYSLADTVEGGARISSSWIRSEVAAGHIRSANRLLGHCWCFVTPVRRNSKSRSLTGTIPADVVLPPAGNYLVTLSSSPYANGTAFEAKVDDTGTFRIFPALDRWDDIDVSQCQFVSVMDRLPEVER